MVINNGKIRSESSRGVTENKSQVESTGKRWMFVNRANNKIAATVVFIGWLIVSLCGRGRMVLAAPGEPVAPGSNRVPPQITEYSTLDDFLLYAAANNPGLEAACSRWQSAEEEAIQAGAMPDPRFTYGYYLKEVETRVGAQKQRFGISQTVPGGDKRALKASLARREAAVARQHYETARLELFYRVKEAYYEYYYLGRAVQITGENVTLLSHLEQVARTMYKTGTARHGDVIRAQVELGKLEDRLQSLRELLQPTADGLNAVLNRSSGTRIPLPESIPSDLPDVSDDELVSALRNANPDLKSLDQVKSREAAAVSLSRENRKPDLTLGLTLIDTDSAVMPASDSGKDPLMATVTINLPFFRQEVYRAMEREAVKRHRAVEYEKLNLENTLMARLKMVMFGYRDAGRKMGLYRDTLVPKGEQSLKVVLQEFAAGRSSYLDLIDAQRTLLEFKLAYERALTDRAQRLAEIERLTGVETVRESASSTGFK